MHYADAPHGNDQLLLHELHTTLRDMGSNAEFDSLPAPPKGSKPLIDTSISIVDDETFIHKRYLPSLFAAVQTPGTMSAIHQTRESASEIAERVIRQCPDLVLLDYQMRGITGVEVFEQIQQSRSELLVCIGFSSTLKCNEFFMNAGVDGTVQKTLDVAKNIREIASLYKELRHS